VSEPLEVRVSLDPHAFAPPAYQTEHAAGLDVFAHEPNVPGELLQLQNVVLTPHLGSATRQTREAMTRIVVDNILAFERGDALLTPVTV